MSDHVITGDDTNIDLLAILEDSDWPAALIAPDGRIIGLCREARALLQIDTQPATLAIEQLFREDERPMLRELFQQAIHSPTPLRARVHLCYQRQTPLEVDIDLWSGNHIGVDWVTLIIDPAQTIRQRDRLILEFNRMAADLLTADSDTAVFEHVSRTFQSLGMGISVLILNQNSQSLKVVYDDPGPITRTIARSMGDINLKNVYSTISFKSPIYNQVLSERKAIYCNNIQPLLDVLVPPQIARRCAYALQISGQRDFIFAPLITGETISGVIMIWGRILEPGDGPFLEAFAHQIAAVLAQITLRRALEQQVQRLNSLDTTTHAVTSLGHLDSVLHVICLQAQKLLGAEHAAICLPNIETATMHCVMATGLNADEVINMPLPMNQSLVGKVHHLHSGICVDDLTNNPDANNDLHKSHILRSAIMQPLLHQGSCLGVLIVSHTQVRHFNQADLEYLRRYADHAAVAVTNAQLHSALQHTASENARLYSEAEEMRVYLASLIRNTPDILMVIGPDMRIGILNAERLGESGYQHETIEGRLFLDFIPQHLHTEIIRHWNAIYTGHPQSFETEFFWADGTVRAALISAVLLAEYGEVLVMLKDITQRRQIETRIRESEKLAALGRMVAGVAHELNNPLAIVLGIAQLHLMEELQPDLDKDMRMIEHAALRASSIVRELRMFARPPLAQPEPVHLEPLIHHTLNRVAPDIRTEKIDVSVKLATNLPHLTGDPSQFEQILFNIVHNAIQALTSVCPPAVRKLEIRGWQENHIVCLTISDNGPGITSEHLQRIFEPFYTTRGPGQGTGLGLAITYVFVQQQNGQIWIESNDNQGTIVHLTFPITMQEG